MKHKIKLCGWLFVTVVSYLNFVMLFLFAGIEHIRTGEPWHKFFMFPLLYIFIFYKLNKKTALRKIKNIICLIKNEKVSNIDPETTVWKYIKTLLWFWFLAIDPVRNLYFVSNNPLYIKLYGIIGLISACFALALELKTLFQNRKRRVQVGKN